MCIKWWGSYVSDTLQTVDSTRAQAQKQPADALRVPTIQQAVQQLMEPCEAPGVTMQAEDAIHPHTAQTDEAHPHTGPDGASGAHQLLEDLPTDIADLLADLSYLEGVYRLISI